MSQGVDLVDLVEPASVEGDCVYLVHFAEPIGKPQDAEARAANGLDPREGSYTPHAQHYVGYTSDLASRVQAHRRGYGSVLCRVAHDRGVQVILSRVWAGAGRSWESYIKGRKEAPRLCPICSGERALRWARRVET